MNGKSIEETWYRDLEAKYGTEFAVDAGYFIETKPWGTSYTEVFGEEFLTADSSCNQLLHFPGCFYPFHQGHLEVIRKAIHEINDSMVVIVHVDHSEYRFTKGYLDKKNFDVAFNLLNNLNSTKKLDVRLVFEDKMPNGCSRNFTRLYHELEFCNPGKKIWLLCGGDRAGFCMTFKDRGHCIIVGRSEHPNFAKYKVHESNRLKFIEGTNGISSSVIRNSYGK